MLPLVVKIKPAVKFLYVNISVLPKFDKDSSIFLFSKITKNFNAFKIRFDVSIMSIVMKIVYKSNLTNISKKSDDF